MATVSITAFPGTGGSTAPTDNIVYTAAGETYTMPEPCGCSGAASISPNDIAAAIRRARTIQILTLIFWVLLILLILRALFK